MTQTLPSATIEQVREALKDVLKFLGLQAMDNESLQKAIDAGLDAANGIGKGKAKLTIQARAALALLDEKVLEKDNG